MRSSLSSFVVLGLMAGVLALPACEENSGNTGGTGATGTNTAGGGSGGTGATPDGGGGTTPTTGGSGGTGGSPIECKGPGSGTPESISGDITTDLTLTADKLWLLEGIVYVTAGHTLTIEPGTVVMGAKADGATPAGTLVIQPGAKIMADGTADCPIVFTSESPKGSKKSGDWSGIIVLGKAKINVDGGKTNIEGIPISDETLYGGDANDDDSGVLRYVRIEFAGYQLSPMNEINGLTFGGVGNKTVVDYVEVLNGFDDCFEFFGGSVNAKHLLCAFPEDDSFDWDLGYVGKLQFIAAVSKPSSGEDTNGNEGDNDGAASTKTPLSNPTIYNETLCGMNLSAANAKQQFGYLPRRSTKATIVNSLATGFQACLDIRDASTEVTMTNSICFGNGYGMEENNIAFEETAAGAGAFKDDDNGLDERAWFKEAAKKNSEIDPKIDCFKATPSFVPAATLSENAATPPDDGFFDTSAKYIGAFEAGNNWAKGAWVSFDEN